MKWNQRAIQVGGSKCNRIIRSGMNWPFFKLPLSDYSCHIFLSVVLYQFAFYHIFFMQTHWMFNRMSSSAISRLYDIDVYFRVLSWFAAAFCLKVAYTTKNIRRPDQSGKVWEVQSLQSWQKVSIIWISSIIVCVF